MPVELLSIVRALSEGIGCRAIGTPGEDAAADYLLAYLRDAGFAPETHDFSYRGWRLDCRGELTAETGRPIAGLTFPYTLPTGDAGVAGRLVEAGRATIIPNRLVSRRFYVMAADGTRVGRILVAPYDAVRPMPNPRPTDSLPTMVVGEEDLSHILWLVERGIDVRLRTDAREYLATGRNIIVDASGSRAHLLVIAHYDSVFGSPGANDNASGVAVALGAILAARAAGLPVRLVLTAAEELMFQGAAAYLAMLTDEDRLREVAACLCIDMVGIGDQLKLRAPQGGIWQELGHELFGEPILAPAMPASDHWVFHEVGIPAAQITRQFDLAYHSAGDVSERMREDVLNESLVVTNRLIAGLLSNLNEGRNEPA